MSPFAMMHQYWGMPPCIPGGGVAAESQVIVVLLKSWARPNDTPAKIKKNVALAAQYAEAVERLVKEKEQVRMAEEKRVNSISYLQQDVRQIRSSIFDCEREIKRHVENIKEEEKLITAKSKKAIELPSEHCRDCSYVHSKPSVSIEAHRRSIKQHEEGIAKDKAQLAKKVAELKKLGVAVEKVKSA